MSQTAVTLPASLQLPEGSNLESWMQTRIARTSSPRPLHAPHWPAPGALLSARCPAPAMPARWSNPKPSPR